METSIYIALRKIANYHYISDIKFVETQIGIYRLNALHSKGLIRHLIHRDANEVERELKNVLEEYKANSKKSLTN